MYKESVLSSPAWIFIVIGLTVFVTFSCLGKKKKKVVLDKSPSKKVSTSSNQTSRHHSHESEINEDMADGYAMVNLNNVNVLQEKNMNSEPNVNKSSSDNSPKGRSLPPPPEKKPRDEENASHEPSEKNKKELNLYASVDENKKKKSYQGESDSSTLYAKVGKPGEDSEEDPYSKVKEDPYSKVKEDPYSKVKEDPYSKVKEDPYSKVKDCNENNQSGQSKPPDVPPPNPIKTLSPNTTSPTDDNQGREDGGPEYASIDKVAKKQSADKNANGSTSSAPPVPDRNFLLDEDDDVIVNEAIRVSRDVIDPSPPMNHRHQHAMMLGQIQQQQNEEIDVEGPTYDQVCVRESLDHMRRREEIEEERKSRYMNMQKDNAGVYAQIDGDVEEAVYESVRGSNENIQPLEGDGEQQNNEYSVIGGSVAM